MQYHNSICWLLLCVGVKLGLWYEGKGGVWGCWRVGCL